MPSEIKWLTKERAREIAYSLRNRQPMGIVGLNDEELRELVEYVSSLADAKGAMLCSCDCNDLARANSREQCFAMFANSVLDSVAGSLGADIVTESRELLERASSPLSGCKNFYKGIVNKLDTLGRYIVLIFTGYEKLLMMPWRNSFIGLLFGICDDRQMYKTMPILCSQVPLMWCEYDSDPNIASVLYQRTLNYLIREPSQEIFDSVVKSLPEGERRAFVEKIHP